MKKVILILVACLLLSSCETGSNVVRWLDGETGPTLKQFKKKHSQYRYFVRVLSPSTGTGGLGASNASYDQALQSAMNACGVSDCIIHTRGNTVVYNPPSREDQNIAKAQNVCRKVGFTPNTEKFAECTVKMMSGTGGQQTVIVGQRRTNIYPLHCRQMGGASAC